MLEAAVVERKISLKVKENNSSVQVQVAPPVQVNPNNWELDRNLVITVPSVEADTTLNSLEECLAFAAFVINLDILPKSALNVMREVHRILRHRDQCQCHNGKHLLYILFNHRINNRVGKEEAKQSQKLHRNSRPNTEAHSWEPRSTNSITTKTTYWKLKPRLGTRSHHKGTNFYLHYKTHKWAATSRSSTSQPQPPKVIWNDRALQEESNATSNVPNNGQKRWELLEKSYCEQ
ncbi:hypothetical protein F511_31451 [Dorcoceras hygrometricum]|uniref:Uncharacterized protein n=1 Tax=Dorcoceras hygrometricum TaxID=472368 RepID=A0A2Z7B2Q8_9LAMI|nr:hypothetical protein F511_31451 [Dorcoceras hygrometricum]